MSGPAREDVMTALTDIVFAITDFKTTGRRLQLWSKVSAFPACFVRNVKDDVHREGLQARRTMNVEVWFYTNAGQDPDDTPGADLNNLVDELEAALKPDDTTMNLLTLGGIVAHCWIEGEIEYDPGDIDGFGKAVIPIRIILP